MSFLTKTTEDLTPAEWLLTGCLVGCFWLPWVFIPASLFLAFCMYLARPLGSGLVWMFKRKTKEPKPPEPEPDPTKWQLVEQAKQEFREEILLIRSMPLKKHEKHAMRLQAKRKLIRVMWELMQ